MQLLENCLGCFCVTRNKQHSIEISADLAYLSFLFIKDSCTKKAIFTVSPHTPHNYDITDIILCHAIFRVRLLPRHV